MKKKCQGRSDLQNYKISRGEVGGVFSQGGGDLGRGATSSLSPSFNLLLCGSGVVRGFKVVEVEFASELRSFKMNSEAIGGWCSG